MDNIITGAIAVVLFLAFAGGLAESIDAIPFVMIVIIVGAMLVTDFYQSAKEGLRQEKQQNSNAQD